MAAIDPNTGLPITQQATAGTANFTPTTPAVQSTVANRSIDPNTQTVQGQMSKMTDVNNPFYQKWATSGRETAAANGFTNGSMLQTGILNSVMQNALPIATSDASNANAVANLNTVNQNSSNTAYTGALNQERLQNSQLANNMASSNAQLATTAATTNANNATSTSNTNTNAATSMSNAALSQNAGLAGNATQEINKINMDQNMTPAAKQSAIAAIQSTIGAGSNVVSSIGRVGAMLNFNSPNGVSSTTPQSGAAYTPSSVSSSVPVRPASLSGGTPGLPTTSLTNGQVASFNGANYQLTGYTPPSANFQQTGFGQTSANNTYDYSSGLLAAARRNQYLNQAPSSPGTPGTWNRI